MLERCIGRPPKKVGRIFGPRRGTLLITLLISRGFKLGKLDFKHGRVLYFAGENPDDVRMRWLAATQQFGLAPEDIDNVYFVPGVFKFTEISERIKQEMAAQELALVIVDTSAAYFETDARCWPSYHQGARRLGTNQGRREGDRPDQVGP